MSSIILRTATQFLLPLLLMFSLFLLFRGHNMPGGGFGGGLVVSAACMLQALSFGVDATRQLVRVDPRRLIGVGLVVAIVSGLPGFIAGGGFLAGVWTKVVVPGIGELHLGTPLLFDVGVYLVVIGVALTIFLPLAEEEEP